MYNLSYWLGVWKWILKKFIKVNKKYIYMLVNFFKSLFFKNSLYLNIIIKMVFIMFIIWYMLKKLIKKKSIGMWYDVKVYGDIFKFFNSKKIYL